MWLGNDSWLLTKFRGHYISVFKSVHIWVFFSWSTGGVIPRRYFSISFWCGKFSNLLCCISLAAFCDLSCSLKLTEVLQLKSKNDAASHVLPHLSPPRDGQTRCPRFMGKLNCFIAVWLISMWPVTTMLFTEDKLFAQWLRKYASLGVPSFRLPAKKQECIVADGYSSWTSVVLETQGSITPGYKTYGKM